MRFFVYLGCCLVAIFGIVILCVSISSLCGYELDGKAIRSLFVPVILVVGLLGAWLESRKEWQAIAEERRDIYSEDRQ